MAPPRYGEFLEFVFDRPATDDSSGTEWYWEDGSDFSATATETVQLYTHLFRNCGTDLKPYSDAQVGLGLWYLFDNSCSNHMYALSTGDAPEAAKAAAIRSISYLYRDCFERRCDPAFGHLSENGKYRLNMICYMLWDVTPINSPFELKKPEAKELLKAIYDVLEEALTLKNVACLESALHGLGHLAHHFPQLTQPIIDGFVASKPKVRPELLQYAQCARTGRIL